MKIVIGGGARCGKSTLAELIGRQHGLPVYCSDELIRLGWSEASDAFADVIDFGRDGVYEGVATVRALRKMLLRSLARPCSHYLHLARPRTLLTHGQLTMNYGIETIYRDLASRLRRRGVQVIDVGRYHPVDFSSIAP